MPWSNNACTCRMMLVQRISLLLNGLFFAHLLLLYYGGMFVNQRAIDISTEFVQLEESHVTLPFRKNSDGSSHIPVRVIFAAKNEKAEPLTTSSITDTSTLALEKPERPPRTANVRKVEQEPTRPMIYMITPTVDRPTRKADFTRLAQTVRQVPNLHWIVVEDGYQLCGSVTNILKRLVTNHTYLAAPTPDYKLLGFDRQLNKGIFQRNVALEWIRWKHKIARKNEPQRGVVYFADDDNTYDLRLFEMMRNIHLVAVWPVALVGGVKLEKPRMDRSTGQLLGFEVGFAPNRTFAVDMAGFALGLDLVLSNPRGHFPLDTVRGWNEPALFDAFDLSYEDVQVLGLNISTPRGLLEPLVWHTKTTDANLGEETRFKENYGYKTSDEGWEV